MELQKITSDVYRGNLGVETSFALEVNAKAFRVLSDTMYQNKIGSMVRELSCNAYDSHVQNDTPTVPFVIHMPDEFEPWFSVRDFGVGLDDAGVRTILTSYFTSTKDTSNKTVGAFGLGSKTPFAYTDAFTVTAIKDGVRRTYSAFIGEVGVPAVAMLGEPEETDEVNGVEINVPVTKPQDFYKFANEVRDQLTFFDVKPTITNFAGEITWKDYKAGSSNFMECEDIFIGSHASPLKGVWVVQGIVGYPMDTKLVRDKLSMVNRDFLDIISANAALLRFDIGQIEVTASREGVSYSDYTLRNIEARLDNARLNIKSTVADKVNAHPTPWAKACELNGNPTLRSLAKVCEVYIDAPYYVGGKVYQNGIWGIDVAALGHFDTDVKAKADENLDIDEDNVEDEENATKGPKASVLFTQYTYQRKTRRGSKFEWIEGNGVPSIVPSTGMTIIMRDTSNKPVIRLREFLTDRPQNAGPVIMVYAGHAVENDDAFRAMQPELEKRLNGATVIRLSDLPLPTAAARAKRDDYRQPKAYIYDDGDDLSSSRCWGREYTPLKELDGGYYVMVERHNVFRGNASNFAFQLAAKGMLDRPVYGLRQRDIDKLAGNPDWAPLADAEAAMVAKWSSDKRLNNAVLVNAIANDYRIVNMFRNYDDGIVNALKAAFENGTLSMTVKSSLAKLFKLAKRLEVAVNRSSKVKIDALVGQAIRSRPAHITAVNALCDKLAGKVLKLNDQVDATLPLLKTARLPWGPSKGDAIKVAEAAMVDHLVSYCNLFAE